MSDLPDRPGDEDPAEAFRRMFGGAGFPGMPGDMPGMPGGFSPDDIARALHQLGDMMAAAGSGADAGDAAPVSWATARQAATSGAAADDPAVGPTERAAVVEALRLADLWLDPVVVFPSGVSVAECWSRQDWVAATFAGWQELADPVADRVVGAMTGLLPEEAAPMLGPLSGVMRQMGAVFFGSQVGQALASLAAEVVSSTDVGIPLARPGVAALLPANIATFGAGLGVPDDEVRLYVALREAAHHRLFAQAGWLRVHVAGLVHAYARGITIDRSAVEEAMRDVDPSDPQSLQAALGSGALSPKDSPEQQAALASLETVLALVEGWVDHVVSRAAEGHLPSAARLQETVRRRRASGGPAEQTFAALVGLQLRPRRLREAAALWAAVERERGATGREEMWAHPDMLPTAEDLADPDAFLRRRIDTADLEAMLNGPAGQSGPDEAGEPGEPADPADGGAGTG